MLEGFLELLKKVVPGSKGNSSAVDGIFPESFDPSLGGSFGHIRESKGNFLCIVAVRGFIYCKVELDRVHLGNSHFIRAIEDFGFTELEFSGFDYGRQHGGGDRWMRIGGGRDWRSGCGWFIRNSGVLSSRVSINKVLRFYVRVLAVCC